MKYLFFGFSLMDPLIILELFKSPVPEGASRQHEK